MKFLNLGTMIINLDHVMYATRDPSSHVVILHLSGPGEHPIPPEESTGADASFTVKHAIRRLDGEMATKVWDALSAP